MIMKIGRNGSIHEKADVIPDTPDKRAITGVMQQREAAIAEIKPIPTILPADFFDIKIK